MLYFHYETKCSQPVKPSVTRYRQRLPEEKDTRYVRALITIAQRRILILDKVC